MVTLRSLLLVALSATSALAQTTPGFHDTVRSYLAPPRPAPERDFWFAPARIAPGSDQIILSVNAPVATVAHIQFGSAIDSIVVTAGTTAWYLIPRSWLLESSSIVENKAIHLWSDTDLTAVVGLHTEGSGVAGDVMTLIPSSALGMKYVVASYEGPREGLPSEFTITATHNNTIVSVLPTADLRRETIHDGDNLSVAHAKGILFWDTLQRGQAIQYKTILASKDTGFDVTGTVLQATYPIGVVGASMNTSVPIGIDDYSNDYICDMLPPVENWDKLYYSTSIIYSAFPGPNMFLVIGSQQGQTIYYQDTNGVRGAFYTTQRAYDYHFETAWGTGVWSSDAPFLLVEYGRSRPGTTIGCWMAVVPPLSNVPGTFLLPVPTFFASHGAGYNRINLVFNSRDASTQYDGALLFGTGQRIDAMHSMRSFAHDNLNAASHSIRSDSGIAALIYNYSYDEASAQPLLTGSFAGQADREVPVVTFSNTLTCSHASISDGFGLSQITLDSVLNFRVTPDPSFRQNESMRNAYLDLCTVDSFTNCYARFTAWDMVGNRTKCEVRYNQYATTLPRPGFMALSVSFDTVRVGTSKSLAVVSIQDTSKLPISITKVWTDNPRFTYNASAPDANRLPISLDAGESRSLVFTFSPTEQLFYQTTGYAYSPTAGTISFPLSGAGYIVEERSVRETAIGCPATLIVEGRRISVHLPAGLASAQVEIENLIGGTILNQDVAPEATIDLSALPHGIYFYRLKCEGTIVVGRIVL
jgi:hypothetical protein